MTKPNVHLFNFNNKLFSVYIYIIQPAYLDVNIPINADTSSSLDNLLTSLENASAVALQNQKQQQMLYQLQQVWYFEVGRMVL